MRQELARISIDGKEVPIVRDPERERIEMTIEGQTAFMTYRLKEGVLSLIHTEVPQRLRHKGIGEALARFVLDYAGNLGYTVKPYCPFVAGFIKRHPEYEAVVAPGFSRSPDADADI
jgi:predicted GNAT family acetyltransferase